MPARQYYLNLLDRAKGLTHRQVEDVALHQDELALRSVCADLDALERVF